MTEPETPRTMREVYDDLPVDEWETIPELPPGWRIKRLPSPEQTMNIEPDND
jgi:hypothetical protein